jgi:hypothetical protein
MASLDSKPVERYTVVTRGVSNNAISTGRVFRNGATATTVRQPGPVSLGYMQPAQAAPRR